MWEETKLERYGGDPTEEQMEQWRISNDRREVDFVSIIPSQNIILQAETKAAADNASVETKEEAISKGIDQLKVFKGYLERMHGPAVAKFQFIPALAFPNLSKRYKCFCQNSHVESKESVMDDSHGQSSKTEAACSLHTDSTSVDTGETNQNNSEKIEVPKTNQNGKKKRNLSCTDLGSVLTKMGRLGVEN